MAEAAAAGVTLAAAVTGWTKEAWAAAGMCLAAVSSAAAAAALAGWEADAGSDADESAPVHGGCRLPQCPQLLLVVVGAWAAGMLQLQLQLLLFQLAACQVVLEVAAVLLAASP